MRARERLTALLLGTKKAEPLLFMSVQIDV
jgi:hypothetical protein